MTEMTSLASILEPSLRDLDETVSDFRDTSFQSSESVLQRFVHHLDEEPLAGFLKAVLPVPDFDGWLAKAQNTIGSMVGSGTLEWPPSRSERVAMQVALCRAILNKTVRFLDFVHNFMYTGRDVARHVDDFATKLLNPLMRDIARLTESRPLSPVLFEAMGTLPPSGNHILDALLHDACKKFQDAAPKSRAEGIEKLWDAWERLKSIEVQGDKRMSVARLLEQCSREPMFRARLDAEARHLPKSATRSKSVTLRLTR
ncbi:hypothetical protein [Polaromonas sp. JS666]|uniref:hypothetical protein n=1 Tax=Polaromonas sp. (strain JS666 / ATCC BAA-500) TaxID=296591 RepID=UPI0000531A50|nr:hypothetical protein [Polaromonas sp. JS666]ABE46900.1 hypothetical protein Bpro_5028 [Polaromonas sp. JS666]